MAGEALTCECLFGFWCVEWSWGRGGGEWRKRKRVSFFFFFALFGRRRRQLEKKEQKSQKLLFPPRAPREENALSLSSSPSEDEPESLNK